MMELLTSLEGKEPPAQVTEPFTIPTDGDEPEQNWWPQWTRDHFPSYEVFWVERIVPLTYRVKNRGNVRFQTTAELAAAGYTDEDVTVAQLHYTLLMHLGRVFELLDDARAFTSPVPVANAFGRYQFSETFTRLSGASDVTDEILARRADPGKYAAWDERQGQRARTAWRAVYPDPLQLVRSYRNRLVHGRVVPEVYVDATNAQGHAVGQILLYPQLNEVDKYLDWRIAFEEAGGATPSPNFAEAAQIGREAWELVVGYVESAWKRHLLESL
jgi:hypothetical protein